MLDAVCCPVCGKSLPADAREGLCPACLIAGALDGSATSAGAGESTSHLQRAAAADFSFPPAVPRYRIVRLISAGGMGEVYEAQQEHPSRPVALKVIRAGLSTRKHLRRLEYEAEVLGRLQHPGIAQVYESGTFESDGGTQPFFAMELVRGPGGQQAPTLCEYANQKKLTTRQRLELLARVCDAVHRAHQQGVIHRDLKPANILVDETGQPKVLDFGVARVIDSDLHAATVQTDIGQLVGTLPYMSPEQASGDPAQIDTRCDVYALGVIAYELLTGGPPHDFKEVTLPEAVRIICEEEPASLGGCNKAFRGDVETIVAKALAKEKERRYASAAELADDIRRFLADEPIAARPASARYQLIKFARRHRAQAIAGAAVAVALILGILGTSIGMVRARQAATRATQQAQRATQEAAKSDAVIQFVQEMLSSANPWGGKAADLTVRQVLDEAAVKIDSGSLAHQPHVEAAVRTTLGLSYKGLGLYSQAEPQLRKAKVMLQDLYGAESAEFAAALDNLGQLLTQTIPFEAEQSEAVMLCRQALEIRRRLLGDNSLPVAASLTHLAFALRHIHENAAAEPPLRQALTIYRQHFGDGDRRVAEVLYYLANVVQVRGRLTEAAERMREALSIDRKLAGADSLDVGQDWAGLSSILVEQGSPREAERALDEASRILRAKLSLDHPETRKLLLESVGMKLSRDDRDVAAKLLADLYSALHRTPNPAPNQALEVEVAGRLMELYQEWGNEQASQWRKAWTELINQQIDQATAEIQRHPHDAKPFEARAELYASLGRFREASTDFGQAMRLDPSEHWNWCKQGCLLLYLDELDAYRKHCRQMLDRFSASRSPLVISRTAETCLLMPLEAKELSRVKDLVARVVTGEPLTLSFVPWNQLLRGRLEYRQGHFDIASQWGGVSYKGLDNSAAQMSAELLIAMSEHRLGHTDRAKAIVQHALPQLHKLERIDPTRPELQNWLTCQIMWREAQQTLGIAPASTKATTQPTLSALPSHIE